MRIIFIGPQASGKGTQAQIIAKKLAVPHISTGDLVRSTTGELKTQIEEFINKGNLVPDDLMLTILKERISRQDCANGFILEGYPRNLRQAEELEKITKIDKIIEITISDEEAIRRISNRLSCKNCSAVYNKITNPPKKEDTCDACGSSLSQRADDYPEAIKKRLDIYHNETEPILKAYPSVRINGEQPIEKVTRDILKALGMQ